MSSQIEFIKEYSAFIESTVLDEPTFLATLPRYITDESILIEPESLFGRLVGFDGWKQWHTAAAQMAEVAAVQFSTSGSEFFETDNTVLHYYEVTFTAREGYPDGFRTSFVERFELADGKIAKLTEHYADAGALAAFLAPSDPSPMN
ncbi:hypothetical protein [Streptomyces sp. NPDC101181]|uniref:hypothetical protein n=1 Tax=Streptomyces sp. NPDC101181 TaxID=3366125 RepID=UPI00382E6491